jgi:hypothetical protein
MVVMGFRVMDERINRQQQTGDASFIPSNQIHRSPDSSPPVAKTFPQPDQTPALAGEVGLGRLDLKPDPSQIPIHSIQAKLSVSAPEDPDEREADQIADQVVGMGDSPPMDPGPESPGMQLRRLSGRSPGSRTQGQVAPMPEPGSPAANLRRLSVQRKNQNQPSTPPSSPQGAPSEFQMLFRQQAATNPVHPQPQTFEQRLNQSRGGGSPLPDQTRDFMEPRFGADFSGVRVHTDGESVQMNRELQAQAFTHGQDMYFWGGEV